jgi:hypothetical protein
VLVVVVLVVAVFSYRMRPDAELGKDDVPTWIGKGP